MSESDARERAREWRNSMLNQRWAWAHPDSKMSSEDRECALLAAYESHVLAARWVKCEERLPEVFDSVLICDTGTFEVGRLLDDEQWEYERTGPQDDPIRIDFDRVTHWQPIPEAPAAPKEQL